MENFPVLAILHVQVMNESSITLEVSIPRTPISSVSHIIGQKTPKGIQWFYCLELPVFLPPLVLVVTEQKKGWKSSMVSSFLKLCVVTLDPT